jgi:hypothetical protein
MNHAINLDANGERLIESDFRKHVDDVYVVHNQQTDQSREGLEARWSKQMLLGNVSSWDLLKLLHFTVDNTDGHLMYTSQFIHCLQVYNAVKADAERDGRFKQDPDYLDDMKIGALVHDMGKSLSLFGELDGNVDCMNRVMNYTGDGLDNVVFQYNHDVYGHDRLKANVLAGTMRLPQRVLDVCKFHSLREMGALRVPDHFGGPGMAGLHSSLRHFKFATMLVDGDRVTGAEQAAFNAHVTAEADLRRVGFVQHFAGYDLHSKDRTDMIPKVDVQEILTLLRKYTNTATPNAVHKSGIDDDGDLGMVW